MARVYNTVLSALNERPIIALSPDHSVREAASILSCNTIGAAPVLEGGSIIGIFSERDVLQRVVAARLNADATAVRMVMTADPMTIGGGASLARAFAIMIDGGFRHLPVVDDGGQVVAMLSMRDIPLEYRLMHQQWTEWTCGQPAPDAGAQVRA